MLLEPTDQLSKEGHMTLNGWSVLKAVTTQPKIRIELLSLALSTFLIFNLYAVLEVILYQSISKLSSNGKYKNHQMVIWLLTSLISSLLNEMYCKMH